MIRFQTLWVLTFGALSLGPALAATPTGVNNSATTTLPDTSAGKLAYAASANQEIDDYVKAVTAMKNKVSDEEAEKRQCLTNKLTSLSALYSVSSSAETKMKDPTTDPSMFDHEFRKIAVALDKSRTLFAEAQQCTANGTVGSGTTLVDWETALNNVEEELTLAIDELEIDWQPPQLSPFNSSGN